MISPKPDKKTNKKRGLFTLYCLLRHRQTPNLSGTKSKSPRHKRRHYLVTFLIDFSKIWRFSENKNAQANAFYLYVYFFILYHRLTYL